MTPTVTETVNLTYDLAGNLTKETQTAGDTSLVTSHTYDQRGLRTSTTDPRGNVAGADPAASAPSPEPASKPASAPSAEVSAAPS